MGGWCSLKKGLRGRFAMYVPPVLKHLGLAEVEESVRNNPGPTSEAIFLKLPV